MPEAMEPIWAEVDSREEEEGVEMAKKVDSTSSLCSSVVKSV